MAAGTKRYLMKTKHPIPIKKDSNGAATQAPDWESVRVLLEVARRKSFRAASSVLHLSANSVRSKIEQLEDRVRARLLTRHVDGIRLTQEGERVLAFAKRMEENAFELVRAASQNDDAAGGQVRLAVTEGLGSFCIAPRLGTFIGANPNIFVETRSAMTTVDILRLEADVAVQLMPPEQKDVRIIRLGRMHLMLFGAKSYVDAHGFPQSAADFVRHDFVSQIGEQLLSKEDYETQLGVTLGRLRTCSNSSTAHYFNVAMGLGLGLLPTYATIAGGTVIPIDCGLRASQDIWLAYHADANHIPRVRKMIDWLIQAFSYKRYPWFADEFVHPKDFPKTLIQSAAKEAARPFAVGTSERHQSSRKRHAVR